MIGQPAQAHHRAATRTTPAVRDLARPTEAVGRRKDGSCFPMEISTSLVNVGERMLTIGCIRDISARNEQAERERERETALRRDAERDRVAFEAAPIGGMITGRDGTIERVNQAMCDMTGYTADELIGMDSSRLAHPDERQHTRRRHRRPAEWKVRDGALRQALPAQQRSDDRGAGRADDDLRRPRRGDAALRPDRGHHRGPPARPGARAGAVRDARPSRRRRRVPRRRHRPAHAPRRPTCRSLSPSTWACPTPRSS